MQPSWKAGEVGGNVAEEPNQVNPEVIPEPGTKRQEEERRETVGVCP